MAKYIIDIANDDYLVSLHGVGSCSFKKVTDLKPYTEPDREAIENEVWEFARKLTHPSNGGLYENEKKEIFDRRNSDSVLIGMSYQEAKAKYEAWKREKDKICVGDEVVYSLLEGGTCKFVVLGISGDKAYGFKYPGEYDDFDEYCGIDFLTKTGRHFSEVEKLLEEMRS